VSSTNITLCPQGVTLYHAKCAPLPAAVAVEDIGAAFVVKDSAGQKLAYVYFEDEPGRRSAAKLLSKDEARRIAANFAKLPELFAEAEIIRKRAEPNPSGFIFPLRCLFWKK